MKILIFLVGLALAVSARAQTTTITGPITDASGIGANCTLYITPSKVPNASATKIVFVVIGGDMTGTTSYFGVPHGPQVHGRPLGLLPGLYDAFQQCDGDRGSFTRKWRVPAGGSISIQTLNDRNGVYGRTISELVGSISSLPGTIAQQ